MKRKKICALVMALTVMGGILASGCNKNDETTASASSDTGITISTDTSASSSETSASDSNGSDASSETTKKKVTYEDFYDAATIKEMGKRVTIHGVEFSPLEYNFYFVNEYMLIRSEVSQGKKYPMTNAGFLDLDGKVTGVVNGISQEMTLRDMLNNSVIHDLQGKAWLSGYITEKGLTLTDEIKTSIDKQLEDAKTQAESNGMTLEENLQNYYGPDATIDGMREVLQRYELGNLAYKDYIDSYKLTDEEKMIPKVYHVLFMTLDMNTGDSIPEEKVKEAKAKADSMKAEITTLEDIKAKGQLAVTGGEAAEAHEYKVMRGAMVLEFENWCYAPHEVGDVDVIQTMFGYHVMYYEGKEEATEDERMTIAAKKMQDGIEADIKAGGYEPTYN